MWIASYCSHSDLEGEIEMAGEMSFEDIATPRFNWIGMGEPSDEQIKEMIDQVIGDEIEANDDPETTAEDYDVHIEEWGKAKYDNPACPKEFRTVSIDLDATPVALIVIWKLEVP